jgi:hypothetical protein
MTRYYSNGQPIPQGGEDPANVAAAEQLWDQHYQQRAAASGGTYTPTYTDANGQVQEGQKTYSASGAYPNSIFGKLLAYRDNTALFGRGAPGANQPLIGQGATALGAGNEAVRQATGGANRWLNEKDAQYLGGYGRTVAEDLQRGVVDAPMMVADAPAALYDALRPSSWAAPKYMTPLVHKALNVPELPPDASMTHRIISNAIPVAIGAAASGGSSLLGAGVRGLVASAGSQAGRAGLGEVGAYFGDRGWGERAGSFFGGFGEPIFRGLVPTRDLAPSPSQSPPVDTAAAAAAAVDKAMGPGAAQMHPEIVEAYKQNMPPPAGPSSADVADAVGAPTKSTWSNTIVPAMARAVGGGVGSFAGHLINPEPISTALGPILALAGGAGAGYHLVPAAVDWLRDADWYRNLPPITSAATLGPAAGGAVTSAASGQPAQPDQPNQMPWPPWSAAQP